ncbi:hypothetical protein AB6M97_08505 [Streptococcus hillyeri]|uniref:Uncharacterized protein n=1 Tax=Streptococcus hillyeri TaxID=2282420 RepID=A0A3L9DPK1_9STRE|nr:hypothetical protein [Streptococcus hillyeri]RLY03251.1 hypothetical protein EAF07_05600 [Streptococcus hillyeri]
MLNILNDVLQNFGKQQPKERFKKEMAAKAKFGMVFSLLVFLSLFRLSLSSYTLGFLIGIAIGVLSLSLRVLILVGNEKSFNRYYISYYDERSRHIRNLAAQLTFALLVLFIMILIVLFAFWQVKLDYHTLLVVLLFTTLLGQTVIKAILDKLI